MSIDLLLGGGAETMFSFVTDFFSAFLGGGGGAEGGFTS